MERKVKGFVESPICGLVSYVVVYGRKMMFRSNDYSEALERVIKERATSRHPDRIRLTTAQCLPFVRFGNF